MEGDAEADLREAHGPYWSVGAGVISQRVSGR